VSSNICLLPAWWASRSTTLSTCTAISSQVRLSY
jgi:hypothetical protein